MKRPYLHVAWLRRGRARTIERLIKEARLMYQALPVESLEFIIVQTPGRRESYVGLKGTFATLSDACCRKNALPGFYQVSLIVEAVSLTHRLVLTLSGTKTDDELLSYLDAAIRNVGGFPASERSTDHCVVEVYSAQAYAL